ncbi:MAG: hypothetical protein GXO62_03495 [Epsilonproteobacteria bacterium]|nr:hypothetical protein [Campylobacterota bacterium]
MPKVEKIKEELALLREEYKNLFLYLLAVLSGSVTSFYQVVTKKVAPDILLISIVGFFVALFIFYLIVKLKKKMEKLLKELEEA